MINISLFVKQNLPDCKLQMLQLWYPDPNLNIYNIYNISIFVVKIVFEKYLFFLNF